MKFKQPLRLLWLRRETLSTFEEIITLGDERRQRLSNCGVQSRLDLILDRGSPPDLLLSSDQVVFDLRNVLVNFAAACPDRVQLGGNINWILPSGHDSAT